MHPSRPSRIPALALLLLVPSVRPAAGQAAVGAGTEAAAAQVRATEGEPWQYTVGPGDVLGVNIQAGADKHELELTVAGDGTIDVVGAGRLKVQGMTTPKVGTLIASRLRERGIYTSPNVAVNVQEYLSQCVNVSGFVKKQGRFCLRRQTRLLDILAEAEGVDEAEAADTIRIIRKGAAEPLRIRRTVLLGPDIDRAREANIFVEAEDNIHVPRKARVCVVGPVENPDCVPLEDGMTLLQVLSVVGGLKEDADRRQVVVRRRTPTGMEEIPVDLDGLRDNSGPLLEPDDQVVVGAVQKTQFCITGGVQKPDCYDHDRGLSLKEAVAKAGGLNLEKTDGRKITLVRKTDGSDVTHSLNLEVAGSGGAGFEIRSGDQITVQETPPVVWVSGNVTEGGSVPWYEGLLLTDALSAAGLSDEKGILGNLTKVSVRRGEGPPQTVNARAMMEGKVKDMPLRPDDRIFVPARKF